LPLSLFWLSSFVHEEDLLLPLLLPLPLQVPAVILNAVKDPEETTRQELFAPFNPDPTGFRLGN
jgi:hypothetical protein